MVLAGLLLALSILIRDTVLEEEEVRVELVVH
jgi:hypothetical protein